MLNLHFIIAWVWKCACFLGQGEKRRWGYLHLKEGRWKQCVFLSFCVRHWKLAQTDVRYFERVYNLPVLPEMGKLWSCNCSAVRAGAWQRFGLNWKWVIPLWFCHDSDTSFPHSSATGYQDKWNLLEKRSMKIQENRGGPEWTIWVCLCSG